MSQIVYIAYSKKKKMILALWKTQYKDDQEAQSIYTIWGFGLTFIVK